MNCIRMSCALALLWSGALAAEVGAESAPVTSRYSLRQVTAEPAPLRSSRYAVRARFAAAESAGDLREGANFTLIGKFAKGGASCSAFALFSDGFE